MRGLSTKGNLHFKIDWVSLIVGSKFTVFALGLYLEGPFNRDFFALLDWGSYIWRGLYMEGLIFAILWYIVVYIKSLNAAWTTINFVIFLGTTPS